MGFNSAFKKLRVAPKTRTFALEYLCDIQVTCLEWSLAVVLQTVLLANHTAGLKFDSRKTHKTLFPEEPVLVNCSENETKLNVLNLEQR